MLLRRPRMSVFGLTDNIYVTQLASTCFLLRIFHRSDEVVTTIPDSFRNIPGTESHRGQFTKLLPTPARALRNERPHVLTNCSRT
jgi:hypothetical protein